MYKELYNGIFHCTSYQHTSVLSCNNVSCKYNRVFAGV